MLASVIYKFLAADENLRAALNSTAAKSKIYPTTTLAVGNVPCLIYTTSNLANDGSDGVSFSETVSLEWYAKTVQQSAKIEAALLLRLNTFENINLMENNAGVMVRAAYLTTGGVLNNYPLENQNYINKSLSFEVKFTKCPPQKAAKE